MLEGLREELKECGYIPVVFDCRNPGGHDFRQTVKVLSQLARFIIVDITNERNLLQELHASVPKLTAPVQPIVESSAHEEAIILALKKYPRMLTLYRYSDIKDLLASFARKVIKPAEAKAEASGK